MPITTTTVSRRSFLKVSALAGGGMMLSFSWLAGCKPSAEEALAMPEEWFQLNGYIKIGENGVVTIMSPNPEGGQNVKTSMPMIVAEELDVDWKNVVVEQANLDTKYFTRQFIGGSQALRQGWKSLRTAGATARYMLRQAAAQAWQVPVEEITTEAGQLHHNASGKSAGYGAMASAAGLEVPEEVALKDTKDFKLIGISKKNVDALKIVTGKPMFGMDTQREGMLIAMIVHPPAFGLKLKSFDDAAVRSMPGIKDVFSVKSMADNYVRQYFDTCTFPEVVAIFGKSTWEVLKAKEQLKVEWEPFETHTIQKKGFSSPAESVTIPSGLESTDAHADALAKLMSKPAKVARRDGNPEAAFKRASKVLERTYRAPFLAHNCMEPMNFFADVTADKALLIGPLQKPELTELAVSERLGLPLEKIDIKMTRLGGGFGRRSYAHWLLEAAVISQKVGAPVKLVYTREDDMTSGIYRPAYSAVYRAALDENNNLIAFHVKTGGIPESPLQENRFPAGAVDNYLAEEFVVNSNLTTGSFRAPRSNFMAAAEQSFLDELAELAGKDPIDFRLELLERAKNNPVGSNNDYDPDRYAGVLKLVREKSNWDQPSSDVSRGVSAYFCHNTYVAQVMDITIEKGQPFIHNVYAAVDCGIVVNPDAAVNMGEGSIVDGIGNALYGELTFENGVPQKTNFDKYRIIRHQEAPKKIEMHFVKNDIDPTGLGEPLFPPTFAAVANALYKATGKRFYDQPFGKDLAAGIQRM
ncbi:MAG: molybdopterin cofactor-binding domain-containing protein [Cyclobacteriaceae bacterium]